MSNPRQRPAPRDETGFSIIVALMVLVVCTLLVFGAIDAVLQNVGTTRADLDQKRALLAADAGLSVYEQQLNGNQNYWSQCPGANGATGVTTTVGATGVTVAGSTDAGSTESYTYANLPATGSTYTGCSTASPITSTIQGGSGSFRVKVVGYSGPTGGVAKISRTLVAQFQPASFLNFVYFTNYEDEDPQWAVGTGGPTNPPATSPACASYAWAGRPNECIGIAFGNGDSVNGPLHTNDTTYVCNTSGSNVTFGRTGVTPTDLVETPNPLAEGSGCAGNLYVNGVQNGPDDNLVGTLQLPPNNSQLLQVANGGTASLGSGSSLAADCASSAGCVFDGPTTIVLDGPVSSVNNTNQMTVTNGGSTATLPYPANGVLYVNATSQCQYNFTPIGGENQLYGGTTLDTNSADTDNAGCGDAVVMGNTSPASPQQTSGAPSCSVSQLSAGTVVTGSGTTQSVSVCPYTQSLTIGASNDVIIAGSLETTSTSSGCPGGESNCPTGAAVLGLIANNNVRVFHPLGSSRNTTNEWEQACQAGQTQQYTDPNTNGTGSLINPIIDAAVLAVNDSFIIDDYDCGAQSDSGGVTQLGQLTLNGAIGANFRGRVGEQNPQVAGYVKNYWYDQRLGSIQPPHFLNPVDASWQVTRVTECDVSATC